MSSSLWLLQSTCKWNILLQVDVKYKTLDQRKPVTCNLGFIYGFGILKHIELFFMDIKCLSLFSIYSRSLLGCDIQFDTLWKAQFARPFELQKTILLQFCPTSGKTVFCCLCSNKIRKLSSEQGYRIFHLWIQSILVFHTLLSFFSC